MCRCYDLASDLDFAGKLLRDFAREGLLRTFPEFDFATRKLPQARFLAVTPFGAENTTILDDHSAHDVDHAQYHRDSHGTTGECSSTSVEAAAPGVSSRTRPAPTRVGTATPPR